MHLETHHRNSAPFLPLSSHHYDVIRKEAWSFYRTISGVRLWWELEVPKRPTGLSKAPEEESRPLPIFVGDSSDNLGTLNTLPEGPFALVNSGESKHPWRRLGSPLHYRAFSLTKKLPPPHRPYRRPTCMPRVLGGSQGVAFSYGQGTPVCCPH